MLKTRILTALVLIPAVLCAIYLLPETGYSLFVVLLTGAGAWEWSRLAGATSLPARVGFLSLHVATAIALSLHADWLPLVLWLGLYVGALACLIVLTYPRSAAVLASRAVVFLFGQTLLLSGFAGMVALRAAPDGAHWVLWSLCIVWAADIGAYFAGRQFGRRKLAPALSPGKTWEGAVGGLLLALVVAAGFIAFWQPSVISLSAVAMLAFAIACFSVLGDLFESALKRSSGVKDSGGLLPGHGGVLDRIDSLFTTLPLAALAVAALTRVV
ncbi:MAG: phosphatidate cytidylyltransferase [Pseudomonadaceae bacterium]|nr:phosphatidate cytidylyltransferase [Pseudomonadaceae bacterium]